MSSHGQIRLDLKGSQPRHSSSQSSQSPWAAFRQCPARSPT